MIKKKYIFLISNINRIDNFIHYFNQVLNKFKPYQAINYPLMI